MVEHVIFFIDGFMEFVASDSEIVAVMTRAEAPARLLVTNTCSTWQGQLRMLGRP